MGHGSAKQGRRYGGFYVVADREVAERYSKMLPGTPTVYTVSLNDDARIYHMTERGAIERLSRETIEDLVSQGYSVVSGYDILGRTLEYAVIDKQAIMELKKGSAL